MNEVDNRYIENALAVLLPTLGIKEPFEEGKTLSLINGRKVKEAIQEISTYLGLPIDVRLSFVPKGYRPNANDGFQSSQLVKTDWRGRGTGSITAQVSIPSDLPIYGSNRMINFPISVRVSEDCTNEPMTFISVMAHELSHVILYSLLHKEKENEFYTDLTTMMLGFADTMKTGRKVIKSHSMTDHGFLSTTTTTTTQTTTYGYLSDDNFTFAFEKIEKMLHAARVDKQRLQVKIKELENGLLKQERELFYFKDYLAYVDKNLGQKISTEDGRLMIAFHQPDYTAELEGGVERLKRELARFRSFLSDLHHYNEHSLSQTKKHEKDVEIAASDLIEKYDAVRSSVTVLRKYVSGVHRFQTFLRLRRR